MQVSPNEDLVPIAEIYFQVFSAARRLGWSVQPMYKSPTSNGMYGAQFYSYNYAKQQGYTEIGWKWSHLNEPSLWIVGSHDVIPKIPKEVLNTTDKVLLGHMTQLLDQMKKVKQKNAGEQ